MLISTGDSIDAESLPELESAHRKVWRFEIEGRHVFIVRRRDLLPGEQPIDSMRLANAIIDQAIRDDLQRPCVVDLYRELAADLYRAPNSRWLTHALKPILIAEFRVQHVVILKSLRRVRRLSKMQPPAASSALAIPTA